MVTTLPDRVYLPEIHDLHPGMASRIDPLLALLPHDARRVVAWSVVPDWQGRAPLTAHPGFCERLRRLEGDIVLHGLTHSLGPDWFNWVVYGHDNRSEFHRLSEPEAARRLDMGRALLTAATGRVPLWFCAPRWQQSASLAGLLRARGFAGWMLGSRLERTQGAALSIPALNFDEGARALPLALGHLRRRGAIRKHLSAGSALRLVLHPDDLDRPASLRHIRAVVAALEANGWRAHGLADLAGVA